MDVIILDPGAAPEGESTLNGYEKKIELLSFSHGVAMQITGDISNTERTSGRPNHQDFTVTKYLDKASPVLNQNCCEGKCFPLVKIIVGRNDSGNIVKLIEYQIKNAIISSISVGGGSGDKPVETLTFNYNHVTWDFHNQKTEGTEAGHVDGKWDLSKNQAA